MTRFQCLNDRRGLLLSLAVLIVAAPACKGDRPALGRVSGTVTLDGRPLERVEINFIPESGRPSIAVTNTAGAYDLIYVGAVRGAKVGSHRVSINYSLVSDDENGRDASEARMPPIPRRYNAETTLTAEVARGRNIFDFALESK